MDHREIIKEQDEQLSEIESSVKRIKENAKMINKTIDEQKVYIKEMDQGMDKTQEQMGFAMSKIGTLLKTKSKGEIKCFLSLFCLGIILFFLLLIL
jgi:peptidoglycan hydrolase CwlO-like protein